MFTLPKDMIFNASENFRLSQKGFPIFRDTRMGRSRMYFHRVVLCLIDENECSGKRQVCGCGRECVGSRMQGNDHLVLSSDI